MCYIFTSLLLPLLLVSNRCPAYGSQIPSVCQKTNCNCTTIGEQIIFNCAFPRGREIVVDGNFLPSQAIEFSITEAGNVVLGSRSFSKLDFLRKVTIRNVDNLLVKSDAFTNLRAPQLFLEITDCDHVELESRAFYILQGPIHLRVTDCNSLKYHGEAIPWISEAIISDIDYVELGENAFAQNTKTALSHHGYSMKIVIQQVSINELPENTFSSPAAEIKLLECDIKTVKRNAFSALEIYSVRIENSKIEQIASGAFRDRSLLTNLQFVNVNINRISSEALLSAGTNFTFSNSNVEVAEKGSFNLSTMGKIYLFNNTFHHIDTRGIILKDWRKVFIENNTLRNLNNEAICVPYDKDYTSSQEEFHFIGNILEKLESNSLKFDVNGDASVRVGENIFIRTCQCDFHSIIENLITGNQSLVSSLYNESFCTVNSIFAKCFKEPEGFMRISEFVESVCNAPDIIQCVKEPITATEQNPNIIKAVGILNENKIDQERKIFSAIMAVILGGFIVMLIFSILMWINRKGYQILDLLSSLFSRWGFSNDMVHATSASSITRVSIHEYAEVWPQKLLTSEEETYVCEDKATQTLPEELTQELLQTLREKLDDPENHSEARNMIEHLYDLIKVEESCNNNEEFTEINLSVEEDLMDNVYDVIRPGKQRIRRYDRSFKTLANKGTRAPSPDKLSPQSFTTSSFSNSLKSSPGPSVTEYMEPSDRRSYIYVELPYDRCGPARNRNSINSVTLADYKDPRDVKIPIYSELAEIMARPLPITPTKNQDQDLDKSGTDAKL